MPKKIIFSSSKMDQGNMSYLYGKKPEVDKNRREFLKGLDLTPEHCMLMDVSNHGDDILDINILDAGKGMLDEKPAPVVDAIICATPSLAVGLLTADCYPVLVVDKNKTILGLAHLGWKGVDLELLPKLIEKMSMMSGILPENFELQIGPGVSAESYVVSNPGQISDQRWQKYLQKIKDNKYQIDLQGFIIDQATKAGIKKVNIKKTNIDTVTSSDYFSHKRSVIKKVPEGRILTAAVLEA